MERKLQASDLADGLARRSNMPHREAETFVRLFFEAVSSALVRENIVKVKGLGSFKLVDVESRESVNINNGERIEIAGHTKVSFTPDPVLRDAVNKPFAEFQTVIINKGTDLHLMESMDLGDGVQPAEEPLPTSAEAEETVAAGAPETLAGPATTVAAVPAEIPEETPVADAAEEARPEGVPVEAADAADPVPEQTPETPSAPPAPAADVVAEEAAPAAEAEPQPEAPAIVQKAAVVEEADVVRHANHVHDVGNTHAHAHSAWHILGACILSVLIFAAGYVAGSVCPLSLPAKEAHTATPARPAAGKAPAPAAPTKARPAKKPAPPAAAPKKRQPSEVLAYPQVEGGEYLIVGIKANDVMSQGKTLLNLSIKYYGSKDFVPYICTMNGITNPDIVPLNMELKIPELKHR